MYTLTLTASPIYVTPLGVMARGIWNDILMHSKMWFSLGTAYFVHENQFNGFSLASCMKWHPTGQFQGVMLPCRQGNLSQICLKHPYRCHLKKRQGGCHLSNCFVESKEFSSYFIGATLLYGLETQAQFSKLWLIDLVFYFLFSRLAKLQEKNLVGQDNAGCYFSRVSNSVAKFIVDCHDRNTSTQVNCLWTWKSILSWWNDFDNRSTHLTWNHNHCLQRCLTSEFLPGHCGWERFKQKRTFGWC